LNGAATAAPERTDIGVKDCRVDATSIVGHAERRRDRVPCAPKPEIARSWPAPPRSHLKRPERPPPFSDGPTQPPRSPPESLEPQPSAGGTASPSDPGDAPTEAIKEVGGLSLQQYPSLVAELSMKPD